MAVGGAHVFPGLLAPVLTQLFFPMLLTTFLTCFCRGERQKYAEKKSCLNRGSPGHESHTLTSEPAGRGSKGTELSNTVRGNTNYLSHFGHSWGVLRGSVVKCLTHNSGFLGLSHNGLANWNMVFHGSVPGQDTSEPQPGTVETQERHEECQLSPYERSTVESCIKHHTINHLDIAASWTVKLLYVHFTALKKLSSTDCFQI